MPFGLYAMSLRGEFGWPSVCKVADAVKLPHLAEIRNEILNNVASY